MNIGCIPTKTLLRNAEIASCCSAAMSSAFHSTISKLDYAIAYPRGRQVSDRLIKGVQLQVIETGCIGICARAPVILLEPYAFLYGGVTPEDIEEIVARTPQEGQVIERLCVKQDGAAAPSFCNPASDDW